MDRRDFLLTGATSAMLTGVAPRLKATEAQNIGTEASTPAKHVVAVSAFGSGMQALQNAINSAADEIIVDIEVLVASDIFLRSNQCLRFSGGRIKVASDAVFQHSVLYAGDGLNISLVGIDIDAELVPRGVVAIKLINVVDVHIEGGRLRRASLWLQSNDNGVDRRMTLSDLTIDMAGARETAIYLNGINGVSIHRTELLRGREGVGIYNDARNIRLSAVLSHSHSQDGFVIINGKSIEYSNCVAKGNGQSGFCTQDLTAGTGARFVKWVMCEASDNSADGFDIHGFKGTLRSAFYLSNCISKNNGPKNGGCGYFVLNAADTQIDDCLAIHNRYQGLFISGSDSVSVKSFRSVSNASEIPAGPNKAGILIHNSNGVQFDGPVSGNSQGAYQEYGLSFTGTSKHARVIDGKLRGNRIGPLFAEANVVSR